MTLHVRREDDLRGVRRFLQRTPGNSLHERAYPDSGAVVFCFSKDRPRLGHNAPPAGLIRCADGTLADKVRDMIRVYWQPQTGMPVQQAA